MENSQGHNSPIRNVDVTQLEKTEFVRTQSPAPTKRKQWSREKPPVAKKFKPRILPKSQNTSVDSPEVMLSNQPLNDIHKNILSEPDLTEDTTLSRVDMDSKYMYLAEENRKLKEQISKLTDTQNIGYAQYLKYLYAVIGTFICMFLLTVYEIL